MRRTKFGLGLGALLLLGVAMNKKQITWKALQGELQSVTQILRFFSNREIRPLRGNCLYSTGFTQQPIQDWHQGPV